MSALPNPDLLLPDPSDLYEHLLTQLEYLKSLGGTISMNKDNFRVAHSQLEHSTPNNWTLNIDPNWCIRIPVPGPHTGRDASRDFVREEGYAIIGGTIEVEDGTFTDYSLHLTLLAQRDSEVRSQVAGAPCCWLSKKNNAKWRVAKQYHFDIDVGTDDAEEKPITHLQSRGNFKDEMLPKGIDSDNVHYCSTPLDKPRLPHPPMDPILIFQLVADQYGCPSDLPSEYWSAKVRESEAALWSDYYSGISDHLNKDSRSDLIDSLVSNSRA